MHLKKLLAQSLFWRGLYFASLLLVNIFLSRFLQAGGAGWVYYLSSIFAFIQLIAGICLESGITFFASGNLIRYNKLLWLSVLWTALIGVLVVTGGTLYFRITNNVLPNQEKTYVFFALGYICGILLINFLTAMFYAQKNFLLPNLVLTLMNIIFVITVLKASHDSKSWFANHLLDLYFSLSLMQGIILVIIFSIKNKSFSELKLPGKAELKKVFSYSLVVLAANVVFFLVYRIDYWFVHNSPVCNDADLGNYIQASKLGQILLTIPQIIASVIFPQMAGGYERAEINKTLMIIARLLLQFFIVLMIAVLLAGKDFFPWVFGSTFNEMQGVSLLLMPGIFCVSIMVMLAAYFSGKGNVKITLIGASLALVFVAVFDFIFIPKYGIYAAAIISTLGYAVNAAYSLFYFHKEYPISVKEFFLWRKTDFIWLKDLIFSNT